MKMHPLAKGAQESSPACWQPTAWKKTPVPVEDSYSVSRCIDLDDKSRILHNKDGAPTLSVPPYLLSVWKECIPPQVLSPLSTALSVNQRVPFQALTRPAGSVLLSFQRLIAS